MSAPLPCRLLELPFGRLALMTIQPVNLLMPYLAAADRTDALRFSSPTRQAEFLSWRAVARLLLGPDACLGYNAAGAPVVRNRPLHISVSHSRDHVAFVCGSQPCAVDIERTDRRFDRALSRILTPHEAAWAVDARSRAALWCAKESLYKLAGETGLDLRLDLRIERFELPEIVGYVRSLPCRLMQLECDGQTIVCGTRA